MTAYYNEIDKPTAEWLRQLIKNGLIADGEVDDRSIVDVEPSDVRGFDQCHWFAGIGGWSYALRLAGVPDNEPVWTASLPCQPFSVAGKGLWKADERHLLPNFLELVRSCRPKRIFGEQVEAAIRHGWVDDLYTEMDKENYAVGFAVLGAHSAGGYHQRQRIYWVANTNGFGCNSRGENSKQKARERARNDSSRKDYGGLAYTDSVGQQRSWEMARPSWVYCQDGKHRPIKSGIQPLAHGLPRGVVYSSNSIITPNETQEERVTRLKGYGNAIVPQIAAEFIKAVMYD